jgi:8-oxo-dGTP diphosphatase
MLQVVAAIIERDGTVLIGRRKPEQSHPLKWEFPGGKVEAGETPAQALSRELEEELAIQNAEGDEIARYEYRYPGRNPVLLIFYRVHSFAGEPRNLIFHEICWAPRRELNRFDFLEGDRDFLRSWSAGAKGAGPG